MSTPASPFLDALVALVRAEVAFVVVGVGGINFYARDASEVVATADLELLLPPDPGVLRAALAALADAGFALEAGGAPFLELDDDLVLGRLIERGANRAALSPDGARIDLMLSIKGFRFDELAGDAGRFRLGGVEVRVARLGKLLRAKELSDRAKDREFLRLYAARLRGEAGGSD